MKYCFGVDLGGTTVKMGLFQEDGTIKEKWEIPTRKENHGEYILGDIAESILEKVKEYELNASEIVGIGMGIPAPVKEDGIVKNTANLGWGFKNVKQELEELTNLTVVTGNDANLAALGEMWLGGGKGHQNMVMVTLGTGVGGGIIVNGTIVAGAHGGAGEIGHLKVNLEETEPCGCGNYGCLEQYASATGIVRLARRRLAKDDKASLIRGKELDAKVVFDAVKEGDELAIEVAEEFGRYLGHALSNVATICNPAVFVIGGGVSKAGEILLKFIEPPFQEKVFFASQDTTFVLAKLGNVAGICGAAKLILDSK